MEVLPCWCPAVVSDLISEARGRPERIMSENELDWGSLRPPAAVDLGGAGLDGAEFFIFIIIFLDPCEGRASVRLSPLKTKHPINCRHVIREYAWEEKLGGEKLHPSFSCTIPINFLTIRTWDR